MNSPTPCHMSVESPELHPKETAQAAEPQAAKTQVAKTEVEVAKTEVEQRRDRSSPVSRWMGLLVALVATAATGTSFVGCGPSARRHTSRKTSRRPEKHLSKKATVQEGQRVYTHRARYWYVMDNLVAKEVKPSEERQKPFSVKLWAALPLNRPGQEVKVGEIEPNPQEILEDPVGGNRVVYWKVTQRPKNGQLVFSYDVTVKNRALHTTLDPSLVQKVDPESPAAKHYLKSEPWLTLTTGIREKAAEIVGDETNPIRQARKVFQWVVEEMTYDYPHIKDRGVSKSFPKRKGDCGEFSHVFITMMRSLGVPARLVTAMWYQGSGHAWAEMYLPPYGWVPVDTSVAQMVKNGLKGQLKDAAVKKFMKTRGIPKKEGSWLFGNLYPNRMEVFIGENVTFTSKTDGTRRTFKFMQPGGTGAWPIAVEIKGVKKSVHAGFFRFGEDAGSKKIALDRAEMVLAASYLKAGLLEKARRGLKKVLAKHPEAAQAWFQMGQVHFAEKSYIKAREAFQRALKGKGGSAKRTISTWCHIFIGMTLDIQGKRKEAVRSYQNAIKTGADFGGSMDMAKKLLKTPYQPAPKTPPKKAR